MRRDKKVLEGRLHYVLPTRIGDTVVASDVTEHELIVALRAIGLKE
jgi:3-dehydroquinate synthetase